VAVPQHRKIVGETIRTYRKTVGLSQEKLAEKAELSPVFISQVERGAENVSLDSLARIARALRVRVHDLTEGF
jgi:transcriptional regulator with XRE-family HTH domain